MSDWPDLTTISTDTLHVVLATITHNRDNATNPVVRQSLALRLYDVEMEIARRNAEEVARRDAAGLPVPGCPEPTIAPLGDSWLAEVATLSSVSFKGEATLVQLADAVPALLTEITRLKLELLSHDELGDALLRTAGAQMEALNERVRALESELRDTESAWKGAP